MHGCENGRWEWRHGSGRDAGEVGRMQATQEQDDGHRRSKKRLEAHGTQSAGVADERRLTGCVVLGEALVRITLQDSQAHAQQRMLRMEVVKDLDQRGT